MSEEIEKIKKVIKQLEGVYKISSSEEQKHRIETELKKLHFDLKKAEAEVKEGIVTESKETEEEELDETRNIELDAVTVQEGNTTLLDEIEIKTIHKNSNDEELNRLSTYIDEFEHEYWAVLSDYHLNLDFNTSMERDTFYGKLEGCKRSIKAYQKTLDEYDRENLSKEYIQQLNNMKTKQRMTLIVDVNEFFREVEIFVSRLIEDYKNSGNIVLNPLQKLTFSKLEGKKKVSGKKVIEGLEQVYNYTNEVINFSNLPKFINKPSI